MNEHPPCPECGHPMDLVRVMFHTSEDGAVVRCAPCGVSRIFPLQKYDAKADRFLQELLSKVRAVILAAGLTAAADVDGSEALRARPVELVLTVEVRVEHV